MDRSLPASHQTTYAYQHCLERLISAGTQVCICDQLHASNLIYSGSPVARCPFSGEAARPHLPTASAEARCRRAGPLWFPPKCSISSSAGSALVDMGVNGGEMRDSSLLRLGLGREKGSMTEWSRWSSLQLMPIGVWSLQYVVL